MFIHTNNINITLYTFKSPSILQNFNADRKEKGGGKRKKKDGVGKLVLTSVIKEELLTIISLMIEISHSFKNPFTICLKIFYLLLE